MTLSDVARRAGEFKTIWALLALCGAGIVLGADTVRHAKEVPTLKELAQEQREANALVQLQLQQQTERDARQDKQIDLMLRLLMRENATADAP